MLRKTGMLSGKEMTKNRNILYNNLRLSASMEETLNLAAEKAAKVIGAETNKDAVRDAKENAKLSLYKCRR